MTYADRAKFYQNYGVQLNTPEGYAIQQALEAKKKAFAANQARDQFITAGYNQNIKGIENWGQSQRQDIDRTFQELGTTQQQDLTSRGLSSTTVAPTVQAGTERERQSSLVDLGDAIQARKNAARSELLGYKERITDAYPDGGGLSAALSAARAKASNRSKRTAAAMPAQRQMGMFTRKYNMGKLGTRQAYGNYMPGGAQVNYMSGY